MRLRPGDGGERRQSQPVSTEGWSVEERVEREQSALGDVQGGSGEVGTSGLGFLKRSVLR